MMVQRLFFRPQMGRWAASLRICKVCGSCVHHACDTQYDVDDGGSEANTRCTLLLRDRAVVREAKR